MSFLIAVFERLTGRPFHTSRTASVEFGPTPGAEIAAVFGAVPDDVLLSLGDELLAAARRIQRERLAAQSPEIAWAGTSQTSSMSSTAAGQAKRHDVPDDVPDVGTSQTSSAARAAAVTR